MFLNRMYGLVSLRHLLFDYCKFVVRVVLVYLYYILDVILGDAWVLILLIVVV